MAVIHEPKKNVRSVHANGCPPRDLERWPRDGDRRMLDWPDFVVAGALVLIAVVIVLLFVLPLMLSSVLP